MTNGTTAATNILTLELEQFLHGNRIIFTNGTMT